MNIAAPAIFIILLLLPGYILRSSFLRTENTQLDHTPFSRATAIAIILAAAVHIAWVFLLGTLFPEYVIPYEKIAMLLLSKKPDGLGNIANSANNWIPLATYYFISLYVACWVVGSGARALIVKTKIDKRFKTLRFDTPWYYILKEGYVSDLNKYQVIVSAVVEVGDMPMVYWGLLDNYFLDKDGCLDRLLLTGARRAIFCETNPEGYDTNTKCNVGSDIVVIRYASVLNLGIEYVSLGISDGKKGGFLKRLISCGKTFITCVKNNEQGASK